MIVVRRLTVLILLTLALVAGSVRPAAAQGQGTGVINGIVLDETGGVLPGVTITLGNAQGVIGGNQETASDERGTFQFLRLIPGTYTVTAQLSGFRTLTHSDINVSADRNSRADFRMVVGGIEETLIVSGAAPLLDTSNATHVAVVTRQEMEALPNRTDIWSMARAIPGIIIGNVDVGGTGQMQSTSAAARGTNLENKWLVDGMDSSSLSGNGTISNFYLDPYMFEETSFVLGASTAEYSSGGLTFNMISRSGTNQVHGGTKFNGTTRALANRRNYSDALMAQLVSRLPARVRTAHPDFVPNADVKQMTDVGAWIGGPLVQNKIWYVGAVHDQRLDYNQLGKYDPSGDPVVSPNTLWNVSGKISWQIGKTAQLSYLAIVQKKLNAVNGGVTFASTSASNYNIKYPTVHQVKYTVPVRSNLAYDLTWNRLRSDNTFIPQPGVPLGAVATYDTTTQTGDVALPFNYDNNMFRDQIKSTLTWTRSAHLVKVGYEYALPRKTARYWSVSSMQANFANGVPVSVNTLLLPITKQPSSDLQIPSDIPLLYSYRGNTQGAFVQDQWTPIPQLVVNAGLRWEATNAKQYASRRLDSIWYPGESFPEVQAPSFKNLSPRLTVVYDVRGNGKTAIKFGASRLNQPVDLALLDRINPLIVNSSIPGGSAAAVADTRQWLPRSSCNNPGVLGCDRNGDLIPQIDELGPSPGYVFPSVNARYADDIKRPIADEFSVDVQQEYASVVFSVGYVVRNTIRNLAQENTAALPSTYTGPLTVTEVTSGKAVQVWNRGTTAARNVFFNSPTIDLTYRGWDITATKRLSHNWSVLAGATLSTTREATRGGDINNPNLQNPVEFTTNALTSNHRPYVYRMSGTYQLPYDFMFSATWYRQAGAPEVTTVLVTAQTITLAQGNQSVLAAPPGSVQLPPQTTLDINVRKAFRLGRSLTVSPRLEIFNLTNLSTINNWVQQLGPTYHAPSEILRSRLIKAEIAIDF